MVGIYSLYTLGLGTGGPRYIWTIPIVVGLMLLVALVFGELASEYPLSGALYQYGKYCVGARYGWFIGWIYGFALLATVASVDSGAVGYVAALSNAWFGTHLDPANHADDLCNRRRDYRALGDPQLGPARRSWGMSRASACTSRPSGRSVSLSRWRSSRSTSLSASSSPRRTSSLPAHNPLRLGLRRSLVDRRGASRRARQRLHFLRLRVGRRHLRRDARSATPSAQSNAQRAALRRHRLVRPRTRSPARDAHLRHRRRRQRRNQHDPRSATRLVTRLLSGDGHRRVLQLRHRRSRCGRPRRLRAGARRRAAVQREGCGDLAAPSHPGQRHPDRHDRAVSLSSAGADQSEQAGSHPLVRLPGKRQRALRARFLRNVGHLSRLLPHRARRAGRAPARLEARAASLLSANGEFRSRSAACSTSA